MANPLAVLCLYLQTIDFILMKYAYETFIGMRGKSLVSLIHLWDSRFQEPNKERG